MKRSLFLSTFVCFSSALGFVGFFGFFFLCLVIVLLMAVLISLSCGVVKLTNLRSHYNCCLPSIQLIKICKSTT